MKSESKKLYLMPQGSGTPVEVHVSNASGCTLVEEYDGVTITADDLVEVEIVRTGEKARVASGELVPMEDKEGRLYLDSPMVRDNRLTYVDRNHRQWQPLHAPRPESVCERCEQHVKSGKVYVSLDDTTRIRCARCVLTSDAPHQ